MHFLALNTERTDLHFDNPIVRQAIDMAIYKPDLAMVFVDGFATPVYSQVHPGLGGTSSANINHYDPEAARALLAQAGIDPSEVSFQINVNNDGWRRMAELMQAQLRQNLGIEVHTIEQLDMATHVTKLNSGDFDAGQTSGIVQHGAFWWDFYAHSRNIGNFNRSRMNDPEIDRMIEAAMGTADINEANRITEEITAHLNDITLHIPLFIVDIVRAHHADLVVPFVDAAGTTHFETVYWRTQ